MKIITFISMCAVCVGQKKLSTRVQPLQEVSNPGASGSILYFTDDDAFVIKTIQHRESKFLLTLLPGYYMNLNQNRCTLLPKFFGLYRLKYNGKKIHFTVLNNILPSDKKMHWKYDLKGSTYNRTVSFYSLICYRNENF